MFAFEAQLVRLPGKIAWTVFYIPAAFTDAFGMKGRIPARLLVDGAEFAGMLLPSNNGHYQVYNEAMRTHSRKTIGETVQVELEVDAQPRTLEIPAEIASALAAHEHANTRFAALPYYIRREEVAKIASAKTPETYEKRLTALIARLSEQVAK